MRPRRQAGVVARPLSFTVRGAVRESVEWCVGACARINCEEPFVAAAQLPTRSSSGCAAA